MNPTSQQLVRRRHICRITSRNFTMGSLGEVNDAVLEDDDIGPTEKRSLIVGPNERLRCTSRPRRRASIKPFYVAYACPVPARVAMAPPS